MKWLRTVTNDMAVDGTIVININKMRINKIDMENEAVAKIVSSRMNQAHWHKRNRFHPMILRNWS